MRFIVTVVFLLSLFSICPADTPSSGPLSIPEEASWLSYYSFRSSHPLLSRDTLNGVLSEGHRLRLEAASAALSTKIVNSPEEGFRSLDSMIDGATKDGLDARSVFAPTLSALRSKLLEGKPEITKNFESISERLDATPSPSVDSRSGYLAWLAARCGTEGEMPDAEYLKAFPDVPWNKGLLKFWGDLHYFGRRFDKAIEIYRRTLAKNETAAADRLSLFFEAEVRQRIGQCHLIQGRADSAAVELSRAAALTGNPERATSRLFEAVSLCRLKRHDEALAAIETLKVSAKPLPDSLVRSLAVQEAVARYGKGEWSKVLDLLKPLAALKDAAYLLPPDRKLVHLLMAGSYRETGDDAKADEMIAAAAQDPPASEVERLDPMIADYEDRLKAEETVPAYIKFVYGTAFSDKNVIKIQTLVSASEKIKVYAFNKFDTSLNDFLLNIEGGTGYWSQGEGMIDENKRFYIPIQSDPLDRQGLFAYNANVSKNGTSCLGTIHINRVVYHISALTFLPKVRINYYLHFKDLNKNGVIDDNEPIHDDKTTIFDPDSYETWVTYPEWNTGEESGTVKKSTPIITSLGSEISCNGFIIPSKVENGFRSRKIPVTIVSISNLGDENVETISTNAGNISGRSYFNNSIFKKTTSSAGKFDFQIHWKMSVEGKLSEIPLGVTDHEIYISRSTPVDESHYYKSLIKFSSIMLTEYSQKNRNYSDIDYIKYVIKNLDRLSNDEIINNNIKYTVEYELYGDYPSYQIGFQIGKFLDLKKGNAAAWVSALKQVLNFQGITVKKNGLYLSGLPERNYSFLTEWTGIGQPALDESEFNLVISGFPGVPSEERGEIKHLPKRRWQLLRTLSFLSYNDGTSTWIIDPVFRHDLATTFMQGIFDTMPNYGTIDKYKMLNERYLSKLSTHLMLPSAACFDAYGKSVFWDLAIPLEFMMKRPLNIHLFENSKYVPSPGDIDCAQKNDENGDVLRTDEAAIQDSSEMFLSTHRDDAAEETELLDIANTFGNISNPSGPGGGSYAEILNRLDTFIATYPQTKYRTFWVYMYDRALLLGVAKKSFEKWYHVPGWWHGDNAYQENKKDILSKDNEARVENFFWSSWGDTVQMDGGADSCFLIGNYYQMAGGTEGLHTSEILLDYTAHPTWNPPGGYAEYKPWALALLGETHSRQADFDPAARDKAFTIKKEFLDVAAGQFAKDNPEVVARSLYTLGADYVFAGKYDEAIPRFESLTKDYSSSIYAPGAKIMLAYALSKKLGPDYERAKTLLDEVYKASYSEESQQRYGYRPWAALVLTTFYNESGQPEAARDFAKKHLALPNSHPGDLAPYSPFYVAWDMTHDAGITVQLARALTTLGDHEAALKALDGFASSYPDENEDHETRIGLPFPPLVYPVWGDDTGDWSGLFQRIQRGERINRSLSTRTAEYEKMKVRFVNPFREAEAFTRATVYINTGRLKEAKTILEALAGSSNEKGSDFHTETVVGADHFLIALSPPFTGRFKQLAEELLKKDRLAGYRISIRREGVPDEDYKPGTTVTLKPDSSARLIVQGTNIDGADIPDSEYSVTPKFEYPDDRPSGKTGTKAQEIVIPTKRWGRLRIRLRIFSEDAQTEFDPVVDFLIFGELKVTVINPTPPIDGELKTIAGSDRVGNLFSYVRTFKSGFSSEEVPQYANEIPCRLSIQPDNDAVRQVLKDKVTVTLEPVTNGTFASVISWNEKPVIENAYSAVMEYKDGYWEAKATFKKLPDAQTTVTYSRYPIGLHDLLYKIRNVSFYIKDGYVNNIEINTKYEMYFGDSLIIDNNKLIDVSMNNNIIDNLRIDNIKKEIYENMCCSKELFKYKTFVEFENNLKMRLYAIKYMNEIAEDSSPYSSGTPYRIGDTYHDDVNNTWIDGIYWESIKKWNKPWYRQYKNISSYDAIYNVEPYSGECEGAMIICIYQSAASVLGKEKFDILHSGDNILRINKRFDKNGIELAKEIEIHLIKCSDFKTFIPGDHIYMKNDDRYELVYPDGEWQGENTIYIGKNDDKYYFSGLGQRLKTEEELRNKLKDEFEDDTDAVVLNPLKDIRFIENSMRRLSVGE